MPDALLHLARLATEDHIVVGLGRTEVRWIQSGEVGHESESAGAYWAAAPPWGVVWVPRLGFVQEGEMARPGIEPGTPRFSVVCSTN
jgi:hypothetical protein